MAYRWADDGIEILKDIYPEEGVSGFQRICPEVPIRCIQYKASYLGIKWKKRVAWNKNLYGYMSDVGRKNISNAVRFYQNGKVTRFRRGLIPWNRGLTKETDKRVRLVSEKVSASLMGRVSWNKGIHLSLNHKKSLSCARNKLAAEGKICRENNPNWNGGASFLPYGLGWNKCLREDIRNRFGRLCMICFLPENGITLHVHHIDNDKGNSDLNNLIPLHRGCHDKTKGRLENRIHWKAYFQDILETLVGDD